MTADGSSVTFGLVKHADQTGLPRGIRLKVLHRGTDLLTGWPEKAGVYTFSVVAHARAKAPFTQLFTLRVLPRI